MRNAPPEEAHSIVSPARTVARLGHSDKPDRASERLGAPLEVQGYRIVPVSPNVTAVLGEMAYARLKEDRNLNR